MLKSIDDYQRLAGQAILDATFLFDRAVAAEKMMRWECIGDSNEAWETGPYLSSGAGKTGIDRSHPYCMRLSIESSVAASLVIGNGAQKNEHGGVPVPVTPSKKNVWDSEALISKLAIIEQFEIYREFAKQNNMPYNKKMIQNFSAENKFILLATKLTERRNELIHTDKCTPSTMKESVEYYNSIRQTADHFYKRIIIK